MSCATVTAVPAPDTHAASLSISSSGDIIVNRSGQLLCYGLDKLAAELHGHDLAAQVAAAAPEQDMLASSQVSRMQSMDSNAILQSEAPSLPAS